MNRVGARASSFLFDQAARLFKAFHGYDPREGDLVAVDMKSPAVALVVGELLYIGYIALGEKTPYMHKFKTNRPLLLASSDGRQLYIGKGRYRFTDRGITP